jgi:hypothetical protein
MPRIIGTRTVGSKSRALWGHISSSVAYCEIVYEKVWTKGTNRCSWTFKNENANVTADCLGNQFISHDLCDENHEGRVETRVQALLASVDNTTFGKVRPCDIHWNWERLLDLMEFQTNALRIFQGHWYVWHIYLITATGCPIIQSLGRKQKL